ncbi:uracil-DNA glycosylase family protein [Qipengyuania sediminis]|uniref:uracil-DNA glycosylase family protein n=1 Tax=Qipengyuania sediminis TaxID=1532023 RepID=UPI001F0E7A1A|nr:uracil-DNA glycosylase family protein [Qipengyuania sediminis]
MPDGLRAEIAACRACEAHLEPRPVATFSPTARLLIIGQAPGTAVHASGVPWDDPSGDRLRQWTGLDAETMYDPAKVALVPMGFCYPGKASGGDKPPRRECAPLWHDRILAFLPPGRLTLLVGSHAQARYLPHTRAWGMTERVRRFAEFLPAFLPLPHPSWRVVGWMRRNPWFEAEIVPRLQAEIAQRLHHSYT